MHSMDNPTYGTSVNNQKWFLLIVFVQEPPHGVQHLTFNFVGDRGEAI